MQQQIATVMSLSKASKKAANDTGDKKHLRQYPEPNPANQKYIPLDWARVMQEEGVKVRP